MQHKCPPRPSAKSKTQRSQKQGPSYPSNSTGLPNLKGAGKKPSRKDIMD